MNIKLPILLLAIFVLTTKLWAQQVPARMEFANMELRLTAGAVKDIQADVDALTRSEKYFLKKLQRVDMYMPTIERIFKEEGLPLDFKYLVIQESALVSDAVSSSNAVGFWQFKEISGLENDLRIDRYIDERMNIVSSSRAAAKYLKNHNQYFNNWAYALIAYQRGRGGAADVIDESNFGKTRLKITSDTYWYLKKFLAHKVAFENAIGTSNPPYYLKEIEITQESNLKTIAKDENVSLELLEEYNKWIKRGQIPKDKNYTVMVPLNNLEKIKKLQSQRKEPPENLPGTIDDQQQQKFPLVDNYPSRADRTIPHRVEINGLKGIYAPKGYTVKTLSETAGVDEYKFRKWNDLKIREALKTGHIYYLRRKRNRAKFYYHTVLEGESMWQISQKYGLKLKKLYRKNRMERPQEPKEGRVLWLRHNRPENVEIEYRKSSQLELVADKPKLEKIVETEVQQSKDTAITESSIKTYSQKGKKDTVSIADLGDATLKPKEIQLLADSALSKIPVSDSSYLNAEEMESNKDSTMATSEKMIVEEEDKDFDDVETDFDEDNFTNYSIKKGDTFFSISNRFNMKISTLLNINKLSIKDTLSIDQVILVDKNELSANEGPIEQDNPDQKQTEEKYPQKEQNQIEHRVTSGETMYALAKKYKVTLKEIMEWNNKKDYNLKEGELIKIKQK